MKNFNYRPLFIIFLCCILGVTYTISLTNSQNGWLVVFAFLTTAFVFLLYLIIRGALNRSGKVNSWLHQNYKKLLAFFVLIFTFGAIFSLANMIKEKSLVEINGEVTYYGQIKSVDNYDTYSRVELKNVYYVLDSEEEKLNSHLTVYLYSANYADNLSVGNMLYGSGEISNQEIKGYNYYNYSSLYSTRLSYSNITIIADKPTMIEAVKEKTKTILLKYMNEENAGLAYGILFGSYDLLDTNIQNVFSIAGLSHLLAVSGMNVAILAYALFLILKKVKANKWVQFGLLAGILFLYAFMCDFTPSVVRASIMSLLFVASTFLGKRYDALSSLSLTGILLFILNPFVLFSFGFQLSFACVFAIITLSPWLTKMFNHIKMPNIVSSILAINLATNIAIIPFCAFYFHKISLLSVVANLLVLPIFNAVYLILLVLIILSLIIPIFGYVLIIPDMLIHMIKHIANFVASIPYSSMIVFGAGAVSFLSVFCLLYTLQYFVGKIRIKSILCAIFSGIFIISFIWNVLPAKYDSSFVVGFKQYYSNSVLLVDEEEVTLIGFHEKDYTRLEEQLMDYKIKHINQLFLYDYTSDVKKINTLIDTYHIENVYISTNYSDIMLDRPTILTSELEINNYNFQFVYKSDTALGVQVVGNDKNIFITNDLSIANYIYVSNIITDKIDYMFVDNLKYDLESYFNVDCIVSQYNTETISNFELDTDNLVCFDI